ncbi:MAG: DNA polymerase III subunit alpha, partial [Alphaproteobacteria bacterium]|nr:DNA polymerase III subunit alpha [Alphaproteobacteria bacterium]
THSAYSLSEGAIGVKELVKLCQKHQMPAVGLTDTNNLFGSLEFSLAAAGDGIQPIIGSQVDFKPQGESGEKNFRSASQQAQPEQLVLLVKSERGYYNLLELVSDAFLNPPEGVTAPMLDYAALEGKTEGLIALTGGIHGGVGRLLLAGRKDDAEKLLLRLNALFPNNLYIELQRHNLPDEAKAEADFIALAMKHNLPLVATNEPFFGAKDKYEAHDALLCIAGGTYITEENRRRLTPQHYFKSQSEMAALFADVPEALANTLQIAKRCAFMSPKREPILPSFVSEEEKAQGIDEAAALREQARAGMEYRLEHFVFTPEMDAATREEVAKPYRDRLEFELDIIIQMQFPGYFLIVSDFIKWSKQNGIPVGPGRGSGAGSAVAWSLLITDLDPLRYGLLFERFLNPERVSMPDFDIDFCQSKRDRVIDYVQKKYGYERVAQIITFGKLQARAVLRDVGRVLQMPYGQIDRISKLVPNNPANPVTLQQAIDMEPQLRAMREEDDSVAKLIDIALQLEGLYRHASTHAAGVVIADRSLDELVPMYRDPKSDMPVVQYSMKYAETAGLVKFDFLGLKTLSVLQQSVEFAKETCGVDIDLLKLPEGDKPTYAMLSKGDAVGVFQFESAGMRDALRKLKPDCLEDLIALGALYRPGPMDNIPTYIEVKHGKQEPDYLHPMLEEVLKETHGVIIYQEQVQKIAQVMGGYTLGGADLLRRAMGKKIKEEMDSHRGIFTEGALKNNVKKEQASHIFDLVAKFAGYGFNKSHAAAYALVSYQTAFMKANYPVEFLAASMNFDMHNTDKLSIFKQEAKYLGIDILTPDVNISQALFSVEKQEGSKRAVRYGLAALKNVGEAAMQALVDERERGGKFKDLFDFVGRVDTKAINKRALENLIRAGALDSLHPNRQQMYESIEVLLQYSNAMAREKESNQVSLFGGADAQAMPKPALKDFRDWPQLERLQHEFAAVGFYLSSHPLEGYAKNLKRMGIVSSGQFDTKLAENYNPTRVAGIVLGIKSKVSPRGKFSFIQLSDVDGIYEISVFDETLLTNSRHLLEAGKLLLINADGKRDDGGVRLIAQGISMLDEAVMKNQQGEVHIFVDKENGLAELQNIIEPARSKTRTQGLQVKLFVAINDNERVVVTLPDAYLLSPNALAIVETLPGISQVVEA